MGHGNRVWVPYTTPPESNQQIELLLTCTRACVRAHRCICVHSSCVDTCAYLMHSGTYIHVNIYIYIYIVIYLWIHTHTHFKLRTSYVHLRTFTCAYLCIPVHTCNYTPTRALYTHAHTDYIHTPAARLPTRQPACLPTDGLPRLALSEGAEVRHLRGDSI